MFKKYIIYSLLWTPFLIAIALTLESLYFLSVRFNKIFFIPDFFVLELIFFTLMIPILHWHKNRWTQLNLIYKRMFLIFVIIGVLDIMKYVIAFVFLVME
jgi:hypothetical protein